MSYRAYLCVSSSVFAAGMAAIVVFTMAVDPFGVSPLRLLFPSTPANPLRLSHDRLVKPYDVIYLQPRTIFIGSSRVKQTFNPADLAGTALAPGYNAGFDGLAGFAGIRPLVDHYLRFDRRLQTILIEAMPTAVLGSRPDTVDDSYGPVRILRDFADAFASQTAINYALGALARRETRIGPIKNRDAGAGYAPLLDPAPHHYSVKNVAPFMLYHKVVSRGERLAPDLFENAGAIVSRCKTYRVDCRFVLTPVHADALYMLHHLGLWPELERLKRGLAALAPTYDFTRYNDLIDERRGPVVFWPEAFHYSGALGSLMTHAIADRRTADMPGNFGVILDPKTIDADLDSWRRERDEWISKHPEIVRRTERAETAYHIGLSFAAASEPVDGDY